MKKLYRSKTNRIMAGILGGLGDYANIDPTILRIIFVILLIFTGVLPFALIYFIMVFVVPEEPVGGVSGPAGSV